MARQHGWILAPVPWSRQTQFIRGWKDGLPLLSWGLAPRDELATYRQLRKRGLRPNGHDPVAVLYLRHRSSNKKTFANLYLIANAAPVRPMTPAKRASIAAALAARRICPVCEEDSGPYIRPSIGMCEACEYSRGLWDVTDPRHDYVIGEPVVDLGALDSLAVAA